MPLHEFSELLPFRLPAVPPMLPRFMLEVGQGAHHPLVLIDDGGFPVMNEVTVWPKLVVMEMSHPVGGNDLELAFYF